MTRPKIDVVEHPDKSLREPILNGLIEFNAHVLGATTPEPLAIVLRDPSTDAVIGGMWAIFIYEWLFVELLFVPEEFRGDGIGCALMEKAENAAVQRGCKGVRLDTYDFQAPGFYEKLGYKPYGKLDHLPKGHAQTLYFKKLPGGEL